VTLVITINIILSVFVLAAIVGSLTWAIMASRDRQATAPTRIKRLRGPCTDGRRGRRPASAPTPQHQVPTPRSAQH
jgi:hypothetical protein